MYIEPVVLEKPVGTVVSLMYCGALKLLLPVVAYLDSIVATLLLNDPLAVDRDALVAYPDPLTVSSELDNAEPVASNAVTLVLKDPEAVDRDALVEYSDADVALYAPVVANAVLSKPSSKSALEAYDAEAIEPEIVMLPEAMMLPVTVSEPEMYGELSIILFYLKFIH